ncbi:uncharacterized protein LOC126899575 isoform X2 [Daktulosphaira vitifoliae]|uniref:uncharacterized protein LOC126899575 isoform X2 n=1 Tax=Daktulosphaira vitifoliae TaxID=58002 RepID=UPI0021A9D2FE|nr:uncharacterized protein LOC126899575 isoform X2 [Daktulosphaira vitifoliae]
MSNHNGYYTSIIIGKNDRSYTIMYRYQYYYTCIHVVIPPLNLMSDNSHDSSSSEIEEECQDDTTTSSNSDVARKLGKSGRDNNDHLVSQKRHRFTKHSSWSIKSRQSFRQHYKQLQQQTPVPMSESQRPPTPATPLASINDHVIPKCDQIDCWPKDTPFDTEHININNNTINNNNSYYNDDVKLKKSFIHPVETSQDVIPVVEHIIIEKQLLSMADANPEDPSSPLSVATIVNGDNDNDDNESSTVFTDAPQPTDSNKNYCMGSTTPLSSISSVSKRHTMELLEKQSFKYDRKIKEIDNNIVTFSKSFLGTVLFVVLFRLLF